MLSPVVDSDESRGMLASALPGAIVFTQSVLAVRCRSAIGHCGRQGTVMCVHTEIFYWETGGGGRGEVCRTVRGERVCRKTKCYRSGWVQVKTLLVESKNSPMDAYGFTNAFILKVDRGHRNTPLSNPMLYFE